MSDLRINDFPKDLHDKLKIESVKKDEPLYKLVIRIIREYFEK
jgi:hypothetical protein